MTESATTTAISAACPECAAQVTFGRPPRRHEIVRCPDCGAELEVTASDPLALEIAPEVEEDWGE